MSSYKSIEEFHFRSCEERHKEKKNASSDKYQQKKAEFLLWKSLLDKEFA